MIDEKKLMKEIKDFKRSVKSENSDYLTGYISALSATEGLIASQPKVGEWIPCSERMPKPEEEVFIQTARGTTTTAMYEDGTVREVDSNWFWDELDGEYDEEEDCYIIPEGWWEYRHYTDDNYNNPVDDVVVAWMPLPLPLPLPEPYREGDSDGKID